MPLFAMDKGRLRSVEQPGFNNEKQLQRLIEENLEAVFRCRFVASEFPTGSQHGGRIDSLALSDTKSLEVLEKMKAGKP